MKKKLLLLLIISASVMFFSTSFKDEYEPFDSCKDVASEKRQTCLRDEFVRVLEKYGVTEGFELLTHLYQKDSNFASTCHDYTHIIGEEAYKRYSRGQKFRLTNATSYCGYGFYHGFILSLFKDQKGSGEATEFCAWANDILSKETSTTSLDCYHGIGHGMVDFNLTDLSNDKLIQNVVDNSLNLCGQVGDTHEQVERCFNGVYHSVLSLTF